MSRASQARQPASDKEPLQPLKPHFDLQNRLIKHHIDILALALEQQEHLEKAAKIDPVSGLPNRQALEAEYAIRQGFTKDAHPYRRVHDRVWSAHEPEPSVNSLLIIDLDNFSAVNNRRGHVEGDRMLRWVADTVRTNIREQDFAARLGGGDEIAVLVGDATADQASVVAEKLRQEVGDQTGITLSVGVAGIQSGVAFEEAYRLADTALLVAKEERNQVVIHDDAGNNRAYQPHTPLP